VIVRPLLSTDLPQLATLSQAVHRRDGYPPHLQEDEVPRYIASDESLMAWVAIDNSQVVGHVALHPAAAADGLEVAVTQLGRPPSDFGVIARLVVDPAARRAGIGRQLLDQATTECRHRGLVPILDVVDRFDPAIELYERAGWRRLGFVDVELDDSTVLRLLVYAAPDPDAT
jgi:ribosomal protein S18 acetylase RimI-like enzyme